jgi:Flp pilus assembly protein TadG
MKKLREFLFAKKENGSSELPTTLLLLPLSIFLLFALIDVSFYMITRAQVQNVLNDGVRQLALYGGNSATLPLNNSGKDVNQIIRDRLYADGECTLSNCLAPPVVTCTPAVATTVGQQVSCTLTYSYKPVVADVFFGFTAAITQPPYTLTSVSISETSF